jgi:hypothetical protein
MRTRDYNDAQEVTPAHNWKPAYDDNPSVIYLLDAEDRIVRANPAWDRFALANHGESSVFARVAGNCILDVIPPGLLEFYRTAYRNVRAFQRDWWHVFECSSPNVRRLFHMRILPDEAGGLLTMNTVISETALEAGLVPPIENYADDGVATMCSHCRRVQRLGQPAAWDWVPELLLKSQILTTFRLCAFCQAYHYPQQMM